MSLTIPVEELYFLMGANAIGFTPESPFYKAFEQFSRTPKDLNAQKLSIQLYAKGFIKSTESMKPTHEMHHRIGIVADPDALYSVMSRIYDRIFYSHFYEKGGEIVEFSCKEDSCFFNEVRTRGQFTQSITTVINGTEAPEIASLSFTIPEYILLGAAFRFQDISDMTGPLESTGKPIHFTVSDVREEITNNPKYDIVDALSPLGSGYTHSELATDPSLFKKILEQLIARGFIAWIDPQKELISVGPGARRLYQLMMKPSALFISIAASHLRTYDWKNTISFFWSDKNLFEISFENDAITFRGIQKEHVHEILAGKVLLPKKERPAGIEKPPEEIGKKEAPTKTEETDTRNFCPKCGWKNERGAAFCPKCGKSLKKP